MKKLFSIVAILFSIIAFAQKTQTRTVGEFSGISNATGISTEITQGKENAVVVSASNDEYLEDFKTEVDKNGVLKIYYKNKSQNWSMKGVKLKAFVTYKSINKLSVTSGSSVEAKNTITSNELTLDVSSGANFKGAMQVTNCEITVSSGAYCKATGSATNTTIDLSSGSNLKATELVSETCKISASSGSDASISVNKKLSASASSGSSIKYKGNPEIEKKTASSGASIKQM